MGRRVRWEGGRVCFYEYVKLMKIIYIFDLLDEEFVILSLKYILFGFLLFFFIDLMYC